MWNGGQDLNDSGEAILLLEPPVQTARINDGVSTTTKHANESFLGGHAIYYANDKHYSTQKLSPSTKCEVCNDHMYLLVQLYAPLDGLDAVCAFLNPIEYSYDMIIDINFLWFYYEI